VAASFPRVRVSVKEPVPPLKERVTFSARRDFAGVEAELVGSVDSGKFCRTGQLCLPGGLGVCWTWKASF